MSQMTEAENEAWAKQARIDRTVEWLKANPDRALHRAYGEGPCKEAELEALLKEAVHELDGLERDICRAQGHDWGRQVRKRFLNRPDVKRWIE